MDRVNTQREREEEEEEEKNPQHTHIHIHTYIEGTYQTPIILSFVSLFLFYSLSFLLYRNSHVHANSCNYCACM